MKNIKIAIDAMGGDHGVAATVPATIDALNSYPDLEVILVGDQELIASQLDLLKGVQQDRLQIVHASQQVTMDEAPSVALRSKKDSSMRVAINLVRENKAGACVSAGNTGALMATARFVLKTLPGIDRPAIVSLIPTVVNNKFGSVRMLDLGANVECSAEHLFQFAVMGSILSQAIDNISKPKIGLLNIGSEVIKGSETVKRASVLLQESEINYFGFVEGTDIFKGTVDIVVCDGFVGNVALKCSEGIATMVMKVMRDSFKQNLFTRFVAFLSMPILKKILKRFDPAGYNGATFLGLNGVVIKSHGNVDRRGFKQAIVEAMKEAEKNIPQRIKSQVALHLGKEVV